CFFFSSRRRHTRFSRDWSSDVCSSDLGFLRICRDVLAGYGSQRPSAPRLQLDSGRIAVPRTVIRGYVLLGPPHDGKQYGFQVTARLGIFLPPFSVQRLVFLCVHGTGAALARSYRRFGKPSEDHPLVVRKLGRASWRE